MAFSCNVNGRKNSLYSQGDLSETLSWLPRVVIDLMAAKEIRPPGILREGMMPAVPRASFNPIITNNMPSIVPASR
jgi:hypothetical protein